MKKEEEEERKKDDYFEEKERQDQLRWIKQRKLNRIEPVEPDPEYKFEELNNHANELLFSRTRTKKQEFIKKTGYLYDKNAEKINKRNRKM